VARAAALTQDGGDMIVVRHLLFLLRSRKRERKNKPEGKQQHSKKGNGLNHAIDYQTKKTEH
jgi:hypothetical protein